jgi:hypothetical protein
MLYAITRRNIGQLCYCVHYLADAEQQCGYWLTTGDQLLLLYFLFARGQFQTHESSTITHGQWIDKSSLDEWHQFGNVSFDLKRRYTYGYRRWILTCSLSVLKIRWKWEETRLVSGGGGEERGLSFIEDKREEVRPKTAGSRKGGVFLGHRARVNCKLIPKTTISKSKNRFLLRVLAANDADLDISWILTLVGRLGCHVIYDPFSLNWFGPLDTDNSYIISS